MTLLTRWTAETAPEEVATVMNDFVQAVGTVPKPFSMLAGSPGLFLHQAGLLNYYRGHHRLGHALLTCIRYLAAKKLDYTACLEFNRDLLKKQGVTDQELSAMATEPATAPLEEAEAVLLAFVIRGLDNADSASPEDIIKLKELGWTESDILDAVNMGFGMMVHGRMMRYFQMEE